MSACYLSSDEEELVADAIRSSPPGIYLLRTLLGEELWALITDPTAFGRLVKKAVKSGRFNGISLGDLTVQNHRTYVVNY